MWVMTSDHMVGQLLQCLVITAQGKILKGAHADMAGGDAGKNRARFAPFTVYPFAAVYGCEGTGGGYAQCVHGFAQNVFAQHRPQRRAAIAITRKRRAAAAF